MFKSTLHLKLSFGEKVFVLFKGQKFERRNKTSPDAVPSWKSYVCYHDNRTDDLTTPGMMAAILVAFEHTPYLPVNFLVTIATVWIFMTTVSQIVHNLLWMQAWKWFVKFSPTPCRGVEGMGPTPQWPGMNLRMYLYEMKGPIGKSCLVGVRNGLVWRLIGGLCISYCSWLGHHPGLVGESLLDPANKRPGGFTSTLD